MSELAKRIALAMLTTDADQPSSEVAVDAELAEVREVLKQLGNDEECWCCSRQVYTTNYKEVIARADDDHDTSCRRASVLYEKLRIDK